ncbi:MAG: hypothetical protein IJT95_00595, partial [Abditibacteriota bacterium]|nr:hypothetical protein [Abditibacteriota bacterium]
MSLIPDFDKASKLILKTGGVVSVQGTRGIGKTMLCRRLIAAAAENNMPAAFIDAELARGITGPPAAVSMALVQSPEDLEKEKPLSSFFIGDVIPAGHTAGYIYGLLSVIRMAKRKGARLIVIDSCGWMDYPGVVLAKQNEIEMTDPDYVICLQRSHESEFIITPFIKRADICCAVRTVSAASTYSPEIAKANFRSDMFRVLRGSQKHLLQFSQATFTNTWIGCGRELKWQYVKAISQILSAPVYHGEQVGRNLYLLTDAECTEEQQNQICSMLKTGRVLTTKPGFLENLYAGLE